MIVAIIPARGGSKRVQNKNIKELGSKPLIYYTIEEAKKSKFIDKIYVTTDSAEIAYISDSYGVSVISRPKHLAEDDTPTLSVLKHAIGEIEKDIRIQAIVLLQPTSPLRKSKLIDKCIEKYISLQCDSVVTVEETETLPTLVSLVDDNIVKCSYKLNGAVYVVKRDCIMDMKVSKKYLVTEMLDHCLNVKGYVTQNIVDIDTYDDFALVENEMNK